MVESLEPRRIIGKDAAILVHLGLFGLNVVLNELHLLLNVVDHVMR